MNPTFDIDSALEMFNDFGPNPFIATAIPELNKTDTSSGIDCPDNSKDNHSATSVLNNLYNNNNNNNSSSNNNTIGLGTSNYWDFLDPNVDFSPVAGLALTPELSPSMSLLSPDVNSINSPYAFDSLYSPSPRVSFSSPFEQSFGSQQSPHTVDFEFDFGTDARDEKAISDFQLFPDCSAESLAVERLLMSPVLTQAECPSAQPEDLMVQTLHSEMTLGVVSPEISSPAITSFGCSSSVNPADTFSTAKLLGQDIQAPGANVAPRKPVQSPTKPKFDPYKKQRRRRITSEDDHRIEIDGVVRYKCDQCGNHFSRPFNLKSHRFTHKGVKPHICDQVDANGVMCGSAFARKHDLERHTRSRHTKNNKGHCKSCGAQFTRSDAHKRHLVKNPLCGEVALAEQEEEQVSHL
ncbi:hypothetical protein BGX28_007460 [Mortierella sp. GBA30]|nr:hypothetical protein BGX28_007460 [Mortierella sp. GBA30]